MKEMTNHQMIANIILKTNRLEKYFKEIILDYVNTDKQEFLENVILNNMIVNLSSKLKVVKVIINRESILNDSEMKKFKNAVMVVLLKRNQIAHSDSLAEDEKVLVDIDIDWNPDGILEFPIYQYAPSTSVNNLDENTGGIIEEDLVKIYKDFIKYYKQTLECISKVISNLGFDVTDIDDEIEEIDLYYTV